MCLQHNIPSLNEYKFCYDFVTEYYWQLPCLQKIWFVQWLHVYYSVSFLLLKNYYHIISSSHSDSIMYCHWQRFLFCFLLSEAQTWSLNWIKIIFEDSPNSEQIFQHLLNWHDTTVVFKKEYMLFTCIPYVIFLFKI